MLENLGIVQLEAWDAPGNDLEHNMALARRRLGGVTLLEWIARRVTDAELLDGTIVLLPGDENGPAAALASLVPPDVPVCFATGAAPLARVVQGLVAHPSQNVVMVNMTNRMVDPDHIDRLVIASREETASDFIRYNAPDRPVSDFPQWCRSSALVSLSLNLPLDPGAPGLFPSEAELAKFEQRWIPLAAREESLSHGVSPAHDDGWEYAQTIFEHLGHECFDGQWVADRASTQTVPPPAASLARRSSREEVLDAG